MQYYDIEPHLLKKFNTVEDVFDILNDCKSDNCNLIILKLSDGASIYDFRNELESFDKTQDYIILTGIPGYEDEGFIGIVDGVRDLATFCMKNYEFDPKTPIAEIAEDCRSIVNQIKDEHVAIPYNSWVKFYPQAIEISAENPL